MGSLKEKLLFVANLKLMIEYMQKKGKLLVIWILQHYFGSLQISFTSIMSNCNSDAYFKHKKHANITPSNL
jgi:hypothetical protein